MYTSSRMNASAVEVPPLTENRCYFASFSAAEGPAFLVPKLEESMVTDPDGPAGRVGVGTRTCGGTGAGGGFVGRVGMGTRTCGGTVNCGKAV